MTAPPRCFEVYFGNKPTGQREAVYSSATGLIAFKLPQQPSRRYALAIRRAPNAYVYLAFNVSNADLGTGWEAIKYNPPLAAGEYAVELRDQGSFVVGEWAKKLATPDVAVLLANFPEVCRAGFGVLADAVPQGLPAPSSRPPFPSVQSLSRPAIALAPSAEHAPFKDERFVVKIKGVFVVFAVTEVTTKDGVTRFKATSEDGQRRLEFSSKSNTEPWQESASRKPAELFWQG